jgi:hypothetical protein
MSQFINTHALWIAPVFSFIVAQLLKYVIYAIQYKVLRKERLTGAGGMPSSHSSGVCTLITLTALTQGTDSPVFAVALIFGLVVMYDAAGVRRAAGLHAKVINMLKGTIDELDGVETVQNADDKAKPLKEFVGHTPLEVFCGALLGIGIGFMFTL